MSEKIATCLQKLMHTKITALQKPISVLLTIVPEILVHHLFKDYEELTQFSILFPKKHYRNRNPAVKFHRSKVFKCMFNFGMLIVETIFKM